MNLTETARKSSWQPVCATFGFRLHGPHSPTCQTCHLLFADGAAETQKAKKLVDSLLSIKKATIVSKECLQFTVWAETLIGLWLRKRSWAAAHFAKQEWGCRVHRSHSDLTTTTAGRENATLVFWLCHTTLGHKLPMPGFVIGTGKNPAWKQLFEQTGSCLFSYRWTQTYLWINCENHLHSLKTKNGMTNEKRAAKILRRVIISGRRRHNLI